jgi:spore coat protein CotF
MDNNQNMNSNTVSNPETEVPKGPEMNDSDFLNDILSTEKHYGTTYATVMNESSNDNLYNEIGTICKETKDMARSLFNLQFKKGWYRLDKAENTKISTINQEYQQKTNELS